MKVLFINPPHSKKRKIIRNISCSYESKGNYLFEPQDFLLLSSAFSSPNDELKLYDFIAHPLKDDEIWTALDKERADLIILMMADCLWNEDLQFLNKLHHYFPKTIWLAGDALLEEENRKEVQSFAQAYIPHPFFLKIETPLNRSQGILPLTLSPHYPDKKIIDHLSPRHELFIDKVYRWPFAQHKLYTTVFTNWGCPYHCEYCINSSFPFHRRSLSDIKTELTKIKELNIKEIYIGDRSFGFPKDETVEFLKMMIDEQFNFSWSCYFHPLHTDEELLGLMKKAGCHTLIVGIEDYKQENLKNYSRYLPSETLDKLFTYAKEFNFELCGDFIFGLPHQNITDLEKLIDYSLTLPINYASYNLLAPLPGTVLRKEMGNSQDSRNFDSLGKQKVFSYGRIPEEKLLKLRNKAIRKFYLRPSYLLKRLCSIKSLEHFSIQFEEMLLLFKKALLK